MKELLVFCLALLIAASAGAFEKKAYTMRDDFGTEPVFDCCMNYYYYTPCPTYSWFWGFYDWTYGDVIGAFFLVGDMSMFTGTACDPLLCYGLQQIRVLDFAGYGTIYPGLFTVSFDVYCSDGEGCPVSEPLWTSGPYETGYAWNYVPVEPVLCLPLCSVQTDGPLGYPRILVTATMIGTDNTYPLWGFDNMSTGAEVGCEFHDYSCLTALYPRPYNSHYGTMHSGYYGSDLAYCPPGWFGDGGDTSADCSVYGFVEAAWRVYLVCQGPCPAEPSTWGSIKTMYR